MADNYLENQYESYLARKAAMGKKTAKKKPIVKVQRLQSEAIEALKDIIAQPSFRMPFDIFREHLYSAEDLYKGYLLGKPGSFKDCYDQQVYSHYLKMGKSATDIKETLARTLHDHSMTNAMNDFLAHFDERQVVGIMGGHGLLRTDEAYRQVVMVSKTLAENGCLMVSGGGPGAMEATHLGAWMAGRTEAETEDSAVWKISSRSLERRNYVYNETVKRYCTVGDCDFDRNLRRTGLLGVGDVHFLHRIV